MNENAKEKVMSHLISHFDDIHKKIPGDENNNNIHIPRVKKFVFSLIERVYTDELLVKLGDKSTSFTVRGLYGGGHIFGTYCVTWELVEDQHPCVWVDIISDKFQAPDCLYNITFEVEPWKWYEKEYWSEEIEKNDEMEEEMLEKIRRYILGALT